MAQADRTMVIMGNAAVVDYYRKRVPPALPNVRVLCCDTENDIAALVKTAPNVQAVLACHGTAAAHLAGFKNLRLVQTTYTGIDWFDFTELAPIEAAAGPVTVCNMREHEHCIAEYILLQMLEWRLRMGPTSAAFRESGWCADVPAFHCARNRKHGEIFGSTLGIVGFGAIGREVATRAAAFGMRIIAVSRTAQDPPPTPLAFLGASSDEDSLRRVLAESDFLLLSCPRRAETIGLINAERLACMKTDAVVMNVARCAGGAGIPRESGDVIEEETLYNALRDRRLGGAILDTWWRYPVQDDPKEPVRPSHLPFHELDNVVGTPHCSGWTEDASQRRSEGCIANLRQFFDQGCDATGLAHTVPRQYWNAQAFPVKILPNNS